MHPRMTDVHVLRTILLTIIYRQTQDILQCFGLKSLHITSVPTMLQNLSMLILMSNFILPHPSKYVFLDVLVKLQSISKSATIRKPEQNRNEYAISQYNKYISRAIDRHSYMKSLGNKFRANTTL